jgi:hypothetical protein
VISSEYLDILRRKAMKKATTKEIKTNKQKRKRKIGKLNE